MLSGDTKTDPLLKISLPCQARVPRRPKGRRPMPGRRSPRLGRVLCGHKFLQGRGLRSARETFGRPDGGGASGARGPTAGGRGVAPNNRCLPIINGTGMNPKSVQPQVFTGPASPSRRQGPDSRSRYQRPGSRVILGGLTRDRALLSGGNRLGDAIGILGADVVCGDQLGQNAQAEQLNPDDK